MNEPSENSQVTGIGVRHPDLVDDLRKFPFVDAKGLDLMREAADEIERLRKLVEEAKQ